MIDMMIPKLGKAMRKMDVDERIELMDEMVPYMMVELTIDEKIRMMQEIMPKMLEDIDGKQMQDVADSMLTVLINLMKIKGDDKFEILETLYHKCFRMATEETSEEVKKKMEQKLTDLFKRI